MGSVHETSGSCASYLKEFRYDPSIGRDLRALVAIKHTTQLKKDREKAVRLKTGVKRIGSSVVRPPELGIVGIQRLATDKISSKTLTESVLLNDPMGIDTFGSKAAIASRDRIIVYDWEATRLWTIENAWFAFLHTVRFSEDGRRLLVASSGYDTIFEVEIDTGRVTWDWNAWEHGYAESVAGKWGFARTGPFAGRTASVGVRLERVGPERYGGSGIPVWQRAAHLNGAAYDRDGNILATLFHQGKAIKIDRASGDHQEVVTGLRMPHGFEREDDGYIVTSSSCEDARFMMFDSGFRLRRTVTPIGLPGTRNNLPAREEWLQYTAPFGNGLYAMVDIHRTCIDIVSPATTSYRRISFPRDWGVQMMIPAADEVSLPPTELVPERATSRPAAVAS